MTGKFFMAVKADSIHEIMPDFSGDKTYTFKVYQDGQEYSVTGVRGEHDGDEIVFYKEDTKMTDSKMKIEYGNKVWRNAEGKLHRLDGPAYEGADGTKEWWVDGKRHRLDGPAIEWADGSKQWWVDGKRHRTDGPAIEWADGSKEWWVEGKRHRLDGPAIEWPDGDKEWYVNGKRHRLDGPAIEYADGSKSWWVDGKRHRLDGPAIEWADGSKSWCVDGKLHRLDGPAFEGVNGYKAWYVDGEELTEAEFKKRKRVGRPKKPATKVIRIPVSKIKVVEKITGKGFAKKQVAHVMVRVPAKLVAKIRKAITLLALCLLPMTASAESLQTEISATVANGAYVEAGEVVGSDPVMVIWSDGSTEYVF